MPTPVVHQPHTVFQKRKWSDSWTKVNGLYCDACTFSASPAVSEAQLSFQFGMIERADSEQLTHKPRGVLDEYYVKVEIQQPTPRKVKKWIGVVVQTVESRRGIGPQDDTSGRQIFLCRGLEYLFQRTILDKSWVLSGNGIDEKEIQRAVAFNLGSGDATARWREANRAQEYGSEGAPIFDVRSGESEIAWSGADAVIYLLKYYPPQDRSGDAKIEFTLDPGYSSSLLAETEPALQVHGKNLKQILDELIDRRRLMSWRIDFDDSEKPVLKVFTFNKDDIDLPSDHTVKANPTQTTFYFDQNANIVGTPKVTGDTATRYDQVIARGERLGACFTISNQTGTLDADWTSTLKTAYQNAATAAAGYGALTAAEKQWWNANARKSDTYQKVYRYFRLTLNWDGKVSGSFVCPDPFDATKSAAFWVPGLRFKPQLPLLSEVDYHTSVTSPTVGTLANSKAEYRRPFALVYDPDKNKYYFLDKLGSGGGPTIAPESDGVHFSVNVRMHDDHCALILDVSGSDQHMIAKNDFTGAEGSEAPPASPVFDWKKIYATIFLELDQYAEQKWPATQPTTDADQFKRLILNVPNARLDYLPASTIIGVDEAGQPITSAGGYVRDDRPRLKDLARTAYAWYGQKRQALEFVQQDLVSDLAIGTLLTEVGSYNDPLEINSVVTQQTYDLIAGTVEIKTQFAELDLKERFV